MRTTSWIGVLALGLLACGNELDRTCDRLDECNLLEGQSVDECTQSSEKDADELNDGERADLDTMLSECLDWESCRAFEDCVSRVRDYEPR